MGHYIVNFTSQKPFGQKNVRPSKCLVNLMTGQLNVWPTQCEADTIFG
jgi:hypothetical protein